MIEANTPRRDFMKSANMAVTLYRAEDGAEGTYSAPFRLSAYVETNIGTLRRMYGNDTECKALLILSGTQPYVSHKPSNAIPAGYTDIKHDDVIVMGDVQASFEDMLESKEYHCYTVLDVSEYVIRGELISVEVRCG